MQPDMYIIAVLGFVLLVCAASSTADTSNVFDC